MVRSVISILGLLAFSSAKSAFGAESDAYAMLGGAGAGGEFPSVDGLQKNAARIEYPSISAPDSLIRLTPGDQLRLRWWGVGNGNLDLVVDTRGDIVIPDMGRIPARDKNFKQIRDTVELILNRRVKANLVDLQIVKVNKAKIRISGLVSRPGVYECAPATTVSKALAMAGFDLSKAIDSLLSDLPGLYYATDQIASLRRVLVVRGSKDTIQVDLMRGLRMGDPTQDPPLFDGDAIRIVAREKLVSVTGSAITGYVEAFSGEPISNLLLASGEVDTNRTVELMDANGSLRQAMPGTTAVDSSLVLVRIKPKRGALQPPVVWVVGQVLNPGAYTYFSGMKAADVLRAAGGIVGGEDSGVVVSTKRGWGWLGASRQRTLPDHFQLPELKVAMVDYINHMRGNYSDPEAILQIGDTIYVYKAEQVVWVAGKVNRPGYVVWKKGADLDYYIHQAGGYSGNAWEDRVQVFDWQTLQAMGRTGMIRPGAAVVVPEERYISKEQWFSIAATTVSLLVAVTSLIVQLSNN